MKDEINEQIIMFVYDKKKCLKIIETLKVLHFSKLKKTVLQSHKQDRQLLSIFYPSLTNKKNKLE